MKGLLDSVSLCIVVISWSVLISCCNYVTVSLGYLIYRFSSGYYCLRLPVSWVPFFSRWFSLVSVTKCSQPLVLELDFQMEQCHMNSFLWVIKENVNQCLLEVNKVPCRLSIVLRTTGPCILWVLCVNESEDMCHVNVKATHFLKKRPLCIFANLYRSRGSVHQFNGYHSGLST